MFGKTTEVSIYNENVLPEFAYVHFFLQSALNIFKKYSPTVLLTKKADPIYFYTRNILSHGYNSFVHLRVVYNT